MKETEQEFQDRINNDRKEFRIEIGTMFDRYIKRAKDLAPNNTLMSAYANAMFDTALGMVPVLLAQLTELTPEVESSVKNELGEKFTLMRDAINVERENQKKKRPHIERPKIG